MHTETAWRRTQAQVQVQVCVWSADQRLIGWVVSAGYAAHADRMPARMSSTMKGSVYCSRYLSHSGLPLGGDSSLRPSLANCAAASAAVKPALKRGFDRSRRELGY